ncbi:hypothetical protein CDIK_1028 [Cucumispora dikerogammari]|nr:hypothetical protein CDIK_1028 [Cucumispora dikerogammari]
MFLLNQDFIFPLKLLVYKIDILNQHSYPLDCSQQNEQVIEDIQIADKRIEEIIDGLKMQEHQYNNRNEYLSLAGKLPRHTTPVTYITETTQKSYEKPIINYPPSNDNIFILKHNDQQASGEPFFYIEDNTIDTCDVFSNTTACFEQTHTIQPLVSDNFEQVNKPIYCTPVETSFYQNNNFETLNNLTDSSFEIFSPVKKLVCEQSDEFNFLSSNEEGLYYPGKFEMEELNPLTKLQTSQKKDVYKKQRLQPKSKRSSKEMNGHVMEPSDKKPKFNNEDRKKKYLKPNSIIDEKQFQLNIPEIDNQNKYPFYTVTIEHSNTHRQHKPDTYQAIEADNNQRRRQIEQDFSQNTVCNASNYTITNSQISIQQADNNRNKNIQNEFRLRPDQQDKNIFKGIQLFEKNTNIKACYMKVSENTPVDGVRKLTSCVKSDLIVYVTIFPPKSGQSIMVFLIKRVPMFLCPVSFVYPVDLEYKVDELSSHEYTFFRDIEITIIQSRATNLCVFYILPKFSFISNTDFFRTEFYVNKIYKLPFVNAEFERDSSKNPHYSDNQHKKKCLEGKLPKTHSVQHILSSLKVYKEAVEGEIYKDSFLNNAIEKLELLRSHLDKMSGVFIFEENGFKRQFGQIIEFNKNFCNEEDSLETLETGTPKAKNLKRAFFRVLAWFKKHMCTFDDFYDFF